MIGIAKGEMAIVCLSDEILQVWPTDAGYIAQWDKPRFGKYPRWETDDVGTRFALPLWFLLTPPFTWIAFREWRRKRVGKGTKLR
jgi:hypothetical protein